MTNTEHRNALGKALEFLGRLEAAKIWYRLEHVRDSLMVVVDVPGYRYEVEFFENGEIEIERFVSTGVEAADDEVLDRLIKEQEEANEPQQRMKDRRSMKNLDADRIIHSLEAPTSDRRPTVRRIEAHAAVPQLIIALRKSHTALVRQILCDILGRRHEKAAVPALIVALQDQSLDVRASAADALAKIGDIRAGRPLLRRLADPEEDVRVKEMVAAALGAVGYRPGIPLLIDALANRDEVLRGCAAWSLGALKANEARRPLELSLAKERGAYADKRMRVALKEIEGGSRKAHPARRRSLKRR